MERFFPVDRESRVTTEKGYQAVPTPEWTAPERAWPFLAQMEQVLGPDSEPDPAFFIESWTLGVAAATESFLQRQQEQKKREQKKREEWEPSFSALDSFPPFFSIEEYEHEEHEPAHDAPLAHAPAATLTERALAADTPLLREDRSATPQNAEPPAAAALEEAFAEYATCQQSARPLTLQAAHRLLGVTATSTREQIRAAYRQMAGRYHPDRLGRRSEQERHLANQRMISINEAYRLLCGSRFRESA